MGLGGSPGSTSANHSERLVETAGWQTDVANNLEECNTIAVEMTRFRSAGFELVEQISQDSTVPESREQARWAITQFAFPKGLLHRTAVHLNQGQEHVDSTQTTTSQAMMLVELRWEGS